MRFQPATAQQFVTNYRFSEFTNIDESFIAQALHEGLYNVGQNWNNEHDYQLGQMLYAAHQMTLAGLGTTTEAKLAADGLLGFEQIRSGQLSVSRGGRGASSGNNNKSAAQEALEQTKHGKEYLVLRRRNLMGPRVVIGQ